MVATDQFWYFLNKLKERLIIMTEYNVHNRIEPTMSDEDVLWDLFTIHDDNDLLHALKRDENGNDDVSLESGNLYDITAE